MMQVQFLSPSHPLWMQSLQQLSYDFYHLPEYVNLEADRIQATPEAVLIQNEDQIFFLPYLLRRWPNRVDEAIGWDIVSPYGYPGFLVNAVAVNSSEFIKQAISQLQQVWKDRGVCSAFLRLHPFINAGIENRVGNLALQVNGETVSIHLAPSLEELWSQTRENHRRGIRRLKQAGFTAEIVPVETNLDSFISIYRETMDRVQAKSLYYFSQDYFTQFVKTLAPRVILCVAKFNQAIVSAGLFMECNGIVQYHLGGTRNAFLKEAPIKLIFDHVRTWSKERGNQILHLGGGLGSDRDSLYHFKLGFANQSHEFCTLRMIVNETEYAAWVALKANQSHQTQETLLNTNFFPAYRAVD
jgi:hypothetical protein